MEWVGISAIIPSMPYCGATATQALNNIADNLH
jgi:hypothetical protein